MSTVLLSMSLSGALLTAAVLLLDALLGRRLSRRWRYYVWLIVVARLLLPLTAPVSLMGALPAPAEEGIAPAAPPPAAVLPGESGGDSGNGGRPAPPAEPAAPDAGGTLRLLRQNLWLVWLAGALLLLTRRVTGYRSFTRLLRAGGRPVEDPARLDRLALLGEEMGVRRPVELWESAALSTPLLLGIRRPCIVLPAGEMPEEDFRYTVCHELIHCRRRDVACKWLAQLALCVHWFNPLVWRMVRELHRSCELACDEAVLRGLDEGERRAYGDALLRAAGRGRAPAVTLPLSEGGALLKERLDAIMNDRGTLRMSGAASLLLALVIAAAAAVSGPGGGAPVTPERGESNPASPAVSLPMGTVPGEIKGDSGGAYRYTQEVYDQSPWFFELGWNVNERAGDCYPGKTLTLPSGAVVTLYYDQVCGGALENPEAVAALTALLDRLREESTNYPLRRALLLSVRSIGETGGAGYAALAERACREDSAGLFSAAFSFLSEEEQRDLLHRCCQEGHTALFAAALSRLPENSPLPGELAQWCYAEGKLSFFSVLANGYMDRETAGNYLRRAEEDGRAGFCSVLYDALNMDEAKEAMERELDRQLAEEYRACGVIQKGKNYYYQGQLVHIFLDRRQPSQSFYRLEMNPLGTIDIKILRDASGNIQGVGYLSETERGELFGE